MVTRALLLLIVGALGIVGSASAQTIRPDRAAVTTRVVIGATTFGTTSPLQVVGLPAKTSQTACAWLDGSGNVFTGACPTGTVTSVGLTMPSLFAVTGTPVTTSGTLAVTLATQTANTGFFGPASGAAAAPTWRAAVKLDLPATTVYTDQAQTFGAFLQTFQGGVSVSGGQLLAGAGASILGTYPVGATAGPGTMSYTSPVWTQFIGDGTGYTWALARRTGSVTTNLLTLLDSTGLFTVANSAVVGGTLLTGDGAGDYTGTPAFTSQTTGWRGTWEGAFDVRYLHADELQVRQFIADLSIAQAGTTTLTKSVALLHADYTLPAAGGASTFVVKDLPSATGIRVFEDTDFVRLRTFNRTAGSLSVGDAWGTVVLDTTYGTAGFDSATKTQRYTFTRHATFGGAGSGTVTAETPVLDYGKAAAPRGVIETTVTDGAAGSYGDNSPYTRMLAWTTPASGPGAGLSVRAQLGNLSGLNDYTTTSCGGGPCFGLMAGDLGAAYLTIDPTNGMRFRNATTTYGSFTGTVLTLGEATGAHMLVNTTGLALYDDGDNPRAILGSAGLILYAGTASAHPTASFTAATGITMTNASGTTVMQLEGANLTLGDATGAHTWINATGHATYDDGNNLRVLLAADYLTFFAGTGSTNPTLRLDATSGILMTNATGTVMTNLTMAGVLTLGNTAAEHLSLTSGIIEFKTASTVLGSLDGTTLTLGQPLTANNTGQMLIDSDSIDFRWRDNAGVTTTIISLANSGGSGVVSIDGGLRVATGIGRISDGHMTFLTSGTGNGYRFTVGVGGAVAPATTGYADLGTSSLTWNQLYFSPTTTTTDYNPLVLGASGQALEKTNGFSGTTVVGGCNLNFESGLFISRTGC